MLKAVQLPTGITDLNTCDSRQILNFPPDVWYIKLGMISFNIPSQILQGKLEPALYPIQQFWTITRVAVKTCRTSLTDVDANNLQHIAFSFRQFKRIHQLQSPISFGVRRHLHNSRGRTSRILKGNRLSWLKKICKENQKIVANEDALASVNSVSRSRQLERCWVDFMPSTLLKGFEPKPVRPVRITGSVVQPGSPLYSPYGKFVFLIKLHECCGIKKDGAGLYISRVQQSSQCAWLGS